MPGRQLAGLLAADGSLQINPLEVDGYTLPPAIGAPGQGLIVPDVGRLCGWGDISPGRVGKILMISQTPSAGSFTKVLYTSSASNFLQRSVLSTATSDLTITTVGTSVLIMAQIRVLNYPTGHSIAFRLRTVEASTAYTLAQDKVYNDSGSNRDMTCRIYIGHIATEDAEVLSLEVNMSSSAAISAANGDSYFSVRE